MTDVLTTAKSLTKQTVGANNNTWGGTLNDSLELIDKALGQTLTLAITANTTLSASQAQYLGYKFTGTPGAGKTVTWPTFYGPLLVHNAITDGSALTCGMATGATVAVPALRTMLIFSDGTDFILPSPNHASNSVAPSDPAGTASTALVMMGLGASCTITPLVTGKVRFQISGVMLNTVANTAVQVGIQRGTGSAPANATPAGSITSTQVGGRPSATLAVANDAVGFSIHGVATGLTIGTPVWYDLAILTGSGGGAMVAGLSCEAIELP